MPVNDALPFANAFKISKIAATESSPCGSPIAIKPSVSREY